MVRINERSNGMEHLVFINRDIMEKECKRLFNCKIDHPTTEIIREPFDATRIAAHLTLGGACVLFVVISFTCYYITHGKVKRAMIQKQRQEYLEYLEEMQDSKPDLRRFHKGPRMAPGYPSLFLPKYILSSKYNPSKVTCSPSHATLIKRMSKKKLEENRINLSKTILVGDQKETDEQQPDIFFGQAPCRCKCKDEINDTGQIKMQVDDEKKTSERENNKDDTRKNKSTGKKNRKFLETSKSSVSEDNEKDQNAEVGSETSHDTVKSEESGVFEQVKGDTEDRKQDQEKTEGKHVGVSKSQKMTAYVKKSCKTKSQTYNIGYRKAISYSNNNYIVEVDNTSYVSTDNDADEIVDSKQTNTDSKVSVKTKHMKRKHKKGSRLKERRSSHSLQEDYDLNKLVKDAEEDDQGFSESGEDTLDGLNGNEQKYAARYGAIRRRSISDNNILHLHHPINTLYCPTQMQPPAMPTIEISSPEGTFSKKERRLQRQSTMPFIS